MDRLIFHIDVNSAFLSWEAARRVAQGEADLRLVPSAIGGDPEKRTGVILAKSLPAKKLGIRTGEPVTQALRKCPDLVLAKPDFRLYEANSKAFMDICREYAPVVEQYSIDECFLDMSGTHRLYPNPIAIAHTIKNRIASDLGFTVNVGISNCKVLAKMASDFEKPDRVHTLFPEEMEQKLWPLKVGELFTVGFSTAEKLEKAGIRTIGDLAAAQPERIQKLVGQKMGRQIQNYALGIDPSPVLAEPEEVKGYSNSVTLERDIRTAAEAHKVLLALADRVGIRIRADKKKAFCVTVTIRSNDFKNKSHQKKLSVPTDITREIYEVSRGLFDQLWDGHTPLRLLGLALTELTDGENAQLSLFPEPNREKARNLDRAADRINSKFGADTIVRGANVHSGLEVGKKHRAQMELKKK